MFISVGLICSCANKEKLNETQELLESVNIESETENFEEDTNQSDSENETERYLQETKVNESDKNAFYVDGWVEDISTPKDDYTQMAYCNICSIDNEHDYVLAVQFSTYNAISLVPVINGFGREDINISREDNPDVDILGYLPLTNDGTDKITITDISTEVEEWESLNKRTYETNAKIKSDVYDGYHLVVVKFYCEDIDYEEYVIGTVGANEGEAMSYISRTIDSPEVKIAAEVIGYVPFYNDYDFSMAFSDPIYDVDDGYENGTLDMYSVESTLMVSDYSKKGTCIYALTVSGELSYDYLTYQGGKGRFSKYEMISHGDDVPIHFILPVTYQDFFDLDTEYPDEYFKE